MFMLSVVCLIALCNSLFLFSMNEQQAGFLVPYHSTSMLNFRDLMNPESAKITIELRELNVRNQQARKERVRKSLTTAKNDSLCGLYNKVSLFFASSTPGYHGLLDCISACNDAKQHGISEDIIGAFAFYHDSSSMSQRTSLFFYLLKDYNARVATTKEVPFKKWSPLAKRLNIVSSAKAPLTAIELLIGDVNDLILKKIPHYYELITLMHAKKQYAQLTDNAKTLSQAWKKQFLYDAFEVVCSEGLHNKLHDIVIIVNQAKKEGLIKAEIDLGYDALSYEPTWEDTLSMQPLSSVYLEHKGKIALLCSFIEKYNTARLGKRTPSLGLYRMYKIIDSLHVLLPDTFDKDFLNPEKIAFAEYNELLDDIDWLMSSYPETIEECVKDLYPPQLSTIIK